MRARAHALADFVRHYVLDWHVLWALSVPAAFAALFPLYWLVVCPRVWAARPDLDQPGSWLLGYWLFACVIW